MRAYISGGVGNGLLNEFGHVATDLSIMVEQLQLSYACVAGRACSQGLTWEALTPCVKDTC